MSRAEAVLRAAARVVVREVLAELAQGETRRGAVVKPPGTVEETPRAFVGRVLGAGLRELGAINSAREADHLSTFVSKCVHDEPEPGDTVIKNSSRLLSGVAWYCMRCGGYKNGDVFAASGAASYDELARVLEAMAAEVAR